MNSVGVIERIFDEISILFAIFILFIPFILSFYYNKKCYNNLEKIFYVSLISFPSILFLSFVYCYWTMEMSKNIVLSLYGFDELNFQNEYKNVNHKYYNEVEKIRNSMMGIGWQLRAIMTYIILILPYNILSCIIIHFYNIYKSKKH